MKIKHTSFLASLFGPQSISNYPLMALWFFLQLLITLQWWIFTNFYGYATFKTGVLDNNWQSVYFSIGMLGQLIGPLVCVEIVKRSSYIRASFFFILVTLVGFLWQAALPSNRLLLVGTFFYSLGFGGFAVFLFEIFGKSIQGPHTTLLWTLQSSFSLLATVMGDYVSGAFPKEWILYTSTFVLTGAAFLSTYLLKRPVNASLSNVPAPSAGKMSPTSGGVLRIVRRQTDFYADQIKDSFIEFPVCALGTVLQAFAPNSQYLMERCVKLGFGLTKMSDIASFANLLCVFVFPIMGYFSVFIPRKTVFYLSGIAIGIFSLQMMEVESLSMLRFAYCGYSISSQFFYAYIIATGMLLSRAPGSKISFRNTVLIFALINILSRELGAVISQPIYDNYGPRATGCVWTLAAVLYLAYMVYVLEIKKRKRAPISKKLPPQ